MKPERILFWDESTQRDLLQPEGSLHVPDAGLIIGNLARLTQFAVAERVPILAVVQSHEAGDGESRAVPPHCVKGTPGQGKAPETSPPLSQVAEPDLLNRQMRRLLAGELSQIVLERDRSPAFSNSLAEKVLRAVNPVRVYLYGVPTEYGIRAAAIGLLEREFPACLVLDAVKAYNEAEGVRAVAELTEKGVSVSTTEEVIRYLLKRKVP